jgi:2-polyprenyl-3-methyl-5-hydroxy-6-metoxy-1,4-benzoquinol methylase
VARYDEIADFYEQRSGKTVRDPATAALLDLAGDVSGLRLLEVACGPGRVARELARRGAALTGLDISAALLAKARAREAAEPLGIGYLHTDVTTSANIFRGVSAVPPLMGRRNIAPPGVVHPA